ncbi:MAG: OmpA family protein [Acidobacteriia bacterium]|nr:OmpA family protein [Terriglobia bacterium]
MKRRPKEHVNHERWLVSYADFITLLFAFFVVLYASSQVDKRKAGRLALAIQVAFQEMGVFETSSKKIPLANDEAIPFEKVQIVENVKRNSDLKRVVDPMNGMLSTPVANQSLRNAQREIQKALDPEISRHEVTMTMHGEGLVVSLKEMGFFDSGSAIILPNSMNAISRLAEVLKTRPENLRIEGHTDNVPIHTARFASNWELSTSRATELIQLLITKYGLPPNRLSAAGYGEFHPLASNDTPAGRAQNRRLDVVILAPQQPFPNTFSNPDPVGGPENKGTTPSPGQP